MREDSSLTRLPEVLPLALTAAVDPALLAVVALLLAREDGDRRLLVVVVSAVAAGIAIGAAMLLGLGGAGFTVPSGLQRAAASEATWPIFVAGAVWGGVPSALYLAALALLAKSGEPVFAAQIGSAAVFQVVSYGPAIAPLLAFLVAPARTRAAVDRANAWMSAHRQGLVAAVLALLGAYLLADGLATA